MRIFELLNRDGYHPKLIEVGPFKWKFDTSDFPEWAPFRVLGGEEGTKAIDPMGGPFIGIGYVIGGSERVCKIDIDKELNAWVLYTEPNSNKDKQN